MSRPHAHIWILAIILLMLIFLTAEVVISKRSEISTGNYDKYLDPLWAKQILQSGRVTNDPFPSAPSLFSNANSYGFNLLPALEIAVDSQVTDVGLLPLHNSPVFALLFFAGLLLAARSLYGPRKVSILPVLFLGCLFFYTNNAIAHEMNRIVLAYSLFYLFLYAYFRADATQRFGFHALAVIFLLVFIFAYSSDAVTALVPVFVFVGFEARRSKERNRVNIAILYGTTCVAYYLVVTNFLAAGISGFKTALEEQGFNIDFSTLFRPSGWPSSLQYLPRYSIIDWALLVYPLLVMGFLFAIALFQHRRAIGSLRPDTPYVSLLIAGSVYLLAVLVANASALLPSAGLDITALFGWIAPLVCGDPLDRFLNRNPQPGLIESQNRTDEPAEPRVQVPRYQANTIRARKAAIVVVAFMIGTVSLANYYTLSPRNGEIVTGQDVAASSWLGTADLVVVSDLHFLSTYVAIEGKQALHYLPLDRPSIEEVFYRVNLSFVREHGATAFVVTDSMMSDYISHFDGTRTVPNPNLGNAVSAEWNLVYDNGADQVFVY